MKLRVVWWLWPAIVAIPLAAQGPEPVRLGLLMPETANREGGFHGRPFELVERTVEGPWGSGSSEITALVFDESVWAILGPLHGRSAHLAEQVAAKGQIALVSPWASDPTLTQANVPWFFRCVPDDRQQAVALVREIFEVRRLDRVVALVADSYDARVAADAFMAQAGMARAVRRPLPETGVDGDSLLARLGRGEAQGIVLFGPGPASGSLLGRLRALGMEGPIFTPLPGADIALRGSEGATDEGLPTAMAQMPCPLTPTTG
jgi:ABC-type branched-subunit amino acid transport system substrate-binding protein